MFRTLTLAAASLALAACGDGAGHCKAPVPAKTETAPAPPVPSIGGANLQASRVASDEARACVQRYAWKLSKSKEDTVVVAQAAVTACDAFIAAATQSEQAGGDVSDMNAAHMANVEAMTRWATLYVVQYRAGVCD